MPHLQALCCSHPDFSIGIPSPQGLVVAAPSWPPPGTDSAAPARPSCSAGSCHCHAGPGRRTRAPRCWWWWSPGERWTKSREISGNFDGLLMDNYCWTIVGLILMEIEMELDNNFCWGILNYLMCFWMCVLFFRNRWAV